MTFQFQLLQSENAGKFTATVLKEARQVFKDIRMSLLNPDPELDPFKIPQFETLEELVFFLALVGDDEELRKKADIIEFTDPTGSFLGLTLRKDREMWLSEEGKAHLKALGIQAFTPLIYVRKQIKVFLTSK